ERAAAIDVQVDLEGRCVELVGAAAARQRVVVGGNQRDVHRAVAQVGDIERDARTGVARARRGAGRGADVGRCGPELGQVDLAVDQEAAVVAAGGGLRDAIHLEVGSGRIEDGRTGVDADLRVLRHRTVRCSHENAGGNKLVNELHD